MKQTAQTINTHTSNDQNNKATDTESDDGMNNTEYTKEKENGDHPINLKTQEQMPQLQAGIWHTDSLLKDMCDRQHQQDSLVDIIVEQTKKHEELISTIISQQKSFEDRLISMLQPILQATRTKSKTIICSGDTALTDSTWDEWDDNNESVYTSVTGERKEEDNMSQECGSNSASTVNALPDELTKWTRTNEDNDLLLLTNITPPEQTASSDEDTGPAK